MKFCTKCGHELNDEAVGCVNCGCMRGAVPNESKMHQTEFPSATMLNQKATNLPLIMNFVSTITAIFSLFFSICSVYNGHVVSSYYSYTYYSSSNVSSYYYPDYDFRKAGSVFALASFIFGLVGFILTLVKKAGIKPLFSSIAHMVFGLLFFILGASYDL